VGWVDATTDTGVTIVRDPPAGILTLLWSGRVEVRGASEGSHRIVVRESELFMGTTERRPTFTETLEL
jgi:hypothetical protein